MPRCLVIALFPALFSVLLSAQMRGVRAVPAPATPFHYSSSGHNFTLRPVSRQGDHLFGRRTIFFGDPYFYGDSGVETPSEPVTPEIVFMQAPPAAAAPEKSSAEPLLFELRGDHFVRVGPEDYASEDGRPIDRALVDLASTDSTQTPRELPPAVLVFRDGHKEEVRSYTITGATIYTAADYWTQGSWTRKIQIADLDVPSTLRLNQERGANFNLPSQPNEVVVRP